MTAATAGASERHASALLSARMLTGMTTPAAQAPMARIARRLPGTCQRSTGPNRARHQAITAAFS